LQHSATFCNLLQQSATNCNALQHNREFVVAHGCSPAHSPALCHAATRCNTLQHTAAHCNILQRTTTHCNALQQTTSASQQSSCALSHSWLRSQNTATHCNTLPRTATHCNVLQHTTTHYNTLTQTCAWCVHNKLFCPALGLPSSGPRLEVVNAARLFQFICVAICVLITWCITWHIPRIVYLHIQGYAYLYKYIYVYTRIDMCIYVYNCILNPPASSYTSL